MNINDAANAFSEMAVEHTQFRKQNQILMEYLERIRDADYRGNRHPSAEIASLALRLANDVTPVKVSTTTEFSFAAFEAAVRPLLGDEHLLEAHSEEAIKFAFGAWQVGTEQAIVGAFLIPKSYMDVYPDNPREALDNYLDNLEGKW